jgi:monovalent cation/proton antiporter MnhG/PhaG subunit
VSGNVVVDVLLAVGVGLQLACCLGIVRMRGVYDRLHYLSATTTVGPMLIVAALLVREGLSTQTLDAIAAVAIMVGGGPVLVHALARAARRRDHGHAHALPEERPS